MQLLKLISKKTGYLIIVGAITMSCVDQTNSLTDTQDHPLTTEHEKNQFVSKIKAGATLQFDSKECRNSGTVQAFGLTFDLLGSVPRSWRNQSPVTGTLTTTDEKNAVFKSGDVNVMVTAEDKRDLCVPWSTQ